MVEVFANHMFDKGLVYKIYQTPKTQLQRANDLIPKWAKDLKRHFEGIWMTNKPMKRRSTSLITREI